MRLFIAFDLDAAVRVRVGSLLRELRAGAPEIKWVAPDSMHLTLKFIGEQPEAKLAEMIEALEAVPRPGPLALSFRGLGCFPNERRPRVFWVGVESPPELARLAEAIDEAMERFGVERERRPFSPHLTLGRTREGRRVELPAAVWEAHRNDDFSGFTATEFFLFESKLAPAGAQHTKLQTFGL